MFTCALIWSSDGATVCHADIEFFPGAAGIVCRLCVQRCLEVQSVNTIFVFCFIEGSNVYSSSNICGRACLHEDFYVCVV